MKAIFDHQNLGDKHPKLEMAPNNNSRQGMLQIGNERRECLPVRIVSLSQLHWLSVIGLSPLKSLSVPFPTPQQRPVQADFL